MIREKLIDKGIGGEHKFFWRSWSFEDTRW